MTPEERARLRIDELLTAAGWQVQDYKQMNLSAATGIALREFQLRQDAADYLLFVNGEPVGVVEAKPEGHTLSGVSEQSRKYLEAVPTIFTAAAVAPPFAYESTGVETFFCDSRDPDSRSRRVFSFHKPETLGKWMEQEKTLRARLREMPSLVIKDLRECQIEAITELEQSFAEAKPRSLIQMATGSGKTFTAVSFVYRLIKHAGARRVLFLVDRSNLGRQTLKEFQQYATPDDGRKFTELYNVQHLTSNKLDPVCKVTITTIQRLYSMLRGEEEYDASLEEHSQFDTLPVDARPKDVVYNPAIPIEFFDFVITDECHRSIYNLWRQVLEYFDSFLIGLTATPSKQTLGFFNQNLVTEYSHEKAVADGVNVGYEVFRIKTEITERGSKVEAGFHVDLRDRQTRKVRWQKLDEDFQYQANQLDRSVVAKDQIRTVIRTFRDNLPQIFPNRTWVPKTLIFAKDDSHAEDIVEIVREEFGKGNEFCKKITYRTTGEKPEDLVTSFRNSPNPRIAVTVDMISTGTDIKPLECLIFMRDVRSSLYFEQMKGRGTRTIGDDDLISVTPDARHKTGFIIVDAVGVCETDKTDSRPLERKRSISFDKLLLQVAMGNRDADTITSLAGRLAKLDRELNDVDRQEIKVVSGGIPLKQITCELLAAVDPDRQIEKAREMFSTEAPDEAQIKKAAAALVKEACKPLDDPKLRDTLIAIKTRNEQVIDTVSQDKVLFVGFDEAAKEKARSVVESFNRFIETNRDELTALQIIYSQPHGKRHLTYSAIKQLAQAIEKPPYNLRAESVWQAYAQLEKSRVRGTPQRVLTDLISLIRFAVGESSELAPFAESVNERFAAWFSAQQKAGRIFSVEQKQWLEMIKDHIATSLRIEMEDFDEVPFTEKGGRMKVYRLFGNELPNILDELNGVLAA
ncbi:MAG: DEAD/DEAH box helicase family protein [Acidobacteria bacterium]|nr:DEAD/DEAH box helicase family protein [Acidobacteriota bacterium]